MIEDPDLLDSSLNFPFGETSLETLLTPSGLWPRKEDGLLPASLPLEAGKALKWTDHSRTPCLLKSEMSQQVVISSFFLLGLTERCRRRGAASPPLERHLSSVDRSGPPSGKGILLACHARVPGVVWEEDSGDFVSNACMCK